MTGGATARIMEVDEERLTRSGMVEMSEAGSRVLVGLDGEPSDRSPIDWHDHVHVDPQIRAGTPVVKGTRVGVEFLLRLFAGGWSEAEALENYPHLTPDDLRAVFALAADLVGQEWWSALPSRGRCPPISPTRTSPWLRSGASGTKDSMSHRCGRRLRASTIRRFWRVRSAADASC